jgi:Flp pilus assembly protein TadG
MVEFALIAPIFLLILLAIVEGGRFVFFYEMLNSATREGARYAIVHGSNAADGCPSGPMTTPSTSPCYDPTGENVKLAVQKAAIGLAEVGDFDSLEVFWCPASGPKPCAMPLTNDRENPVTVRAVYTYSSVIPVLPPITIRSESTLVINN